MEKTWEHQHEEIEREREKQQKQWQHLDEDEKFHSTDANGFNKIGDGSLVEVGNAFEKIVNGKKEIENGDYKRYDEVKMEVREDKSEMNVYYDKEEGIWKCRNCPWTHQPGSPWTQHIEHPKWYLQMLINSKTVNRHEPCFYCEIKGLKSFCGFSEIENNGVPSSASLKSPKDDGLVITVNKIHGQNIYTNGEALKVKARKKYFNEKTVACDNVDPAEESDEKLIEFDVEKVLEEQDTYDLFCPNCNSCKTKRVIIRKRRRKNGYNSEDAKRNKFEAVDNSDDNIYDSEAEVFRCLSCFSFFISSESGFQLLKIFGDTSDEQIRRPVATSNKSWFSSILTSQKEGRGNKRDVRDDIVAEEDAIHETRQNRLKIQISLSKESISLKNSHPDEKINGISPIRIAGTDTIITLEKSVEHRDIQEPQGLTSIETRDLPDTERIEYEKFQGIDIVKSIVYGGLAEFIMSLVIVSSAAGADTATLKILALGLANVIGGLIIVGKNLWGLRIEHPPNSNDQIIGDDSIQLVTPQDRYQELLGQRQNFWVHATIAFLSYLIFGMLPPIIYAFSFRESDNKDHKLVAVAAASLAFISILSMGKAYIQRPPKAYLKITSFYVVLIFMTSGISYEFGNIFKKLLENLEWLSSGLDLGLPVLERATPVMPAWESF